MLLKGRVLKSPGTAINTSNRTTCLQSRRPCTTIYTNLTRIREHSHMTFLLVPHQVTQTTATIWVGWIGDSDTDDTDSRSLKLEVRPDDDSSIQEIELSADNWLEWDTKAEEEEREENIVDSSRKCLPEERFSKTEVERGKKLSFETTVRKLKYQR